MKDGRSSENESRCGPRESPAQILPRRGAGVSL